MNPVDMQGVLNEMRALAARSAALPQAPDAGSTAGVAPTEFQKLLTSTLGQVNALQQESRTLATRFETGEADLVDVMVSMQKSRIAFEGVLQVRNKLVKAYQDIMSMSL